MGFWIVTGGASGIGARVAEDARPAGHRVLVWDIRAADNIEGMAFERLDLSDTTAIAAACDRIAGPVDCFVHCAGVLASTTIVHEGLADAMLLAFRLHCVGFASVVQGLLPKFAQSGASAIAIASIAADMVDPGTLAYGPSKAALRRVVSQLAVELGDRGIRVNCISPGAIVTDITRHLWDVTEYARERLAHVPLGWQGEAVDVSEVVAFLASQAARYVTGEDIRVDGGVRHGIFQNGVREFRP